MGEEDFRLEVEDFLHGVEVPLLHHQAVGSHRQNQATRLRHHTAAHRIVCLHIALHRTVPPLTVGEIHLQVSIGFAKP